jgi:hypothetical protein
MRNLIFALVFGFGLFGCAQISESRVREIVREEICAIEERFVEENKADFLKMFEDMKMEHNPNPKKLKDLFEPLFRLLETMGNE